MNESVKLRSATQLDNAVAYLKKAITEDELHECIIQPVKANRSAAQRRLNWKWNTEYGDFTGETKEEVHHRMKKAFLVNIFTRDNEGYAEMVESLRGLWASGDKERAEFLFDRAVVANTRTEEATVAQMTEFLNLLEMDAGSHGIQLTRPDEYHLALGLK